MITSLLLSSLALQGGTPVLIDNLFGTVEFQGLGASSVDMGDLDGDGIQDFAVSSPSFRFNRPAWGDGRVEVLSGATLLPLFVRDARADIDFSIGDKLLNLGDINADGLDDLFYSANGPIIGYAISGADGAVLYRMERDNGLFLFPESYDNMADLNGDGVGEILMGFWSESWTDPVSRELHFQSGAIRIFNGATGEVMHLLRGDGEFQGFGKTVSSIHDVDGDGVADFASVDAGFGLGNFKLRIFSGATGIQLAEHADDRIDTLSAIHLDALDDFNDDGTDDILFAGHTVENPAGLSSAITLVLSGVDGRILATVRGRDYPWPGHLVSTVGDLDGDGKRDFAIGEPLLVNGTDHFSVRVLSGDTAEPLMVIDTGEINWFGHHFAAIADRDGDGREDLFIGIPNSMAAGLPHETFGEIQIYGLH